MKLTTKFFFLLSLLALGLFGCSEEVLTTKEGSARRVVVTNKDGTNLYDSDQLNNSKSTAKQWDILFIINDKNSSYYKVSSSIDEPGNSDNISYVKKADVLEWNTFFCLFYKNSPEEVNRSPVITYKTLEALKNQSQDTSDFIMSEKLNHDNSLKEVYAKPILQEVDESIYKIASLYDDPNPDGTYEFRGNYGVGYVEYTPEAHTFYRYVSKRQLEEQLKSVLAAIVSSKPNPNPNDLDKKFDELSKIINQPGNSKLVRGAKRIKDIFESGQAPREAQVNIFEEPYLIGKNVEQHNQNLETLHNKMLEYFNEPSNWNEDGNSYIPAEWIPK
ncbi:hypothetical protein H6G94_12130 [Nostoc punctiforme FACHB-252]|uniref:Lipoprotein n=1 Tax=Nostoc punctiforme FACHB-252 TaxID=1357509 RepID=A0ABR8H845_NOSPU|nr:hypothetical protein [Nostoc punctiforme]MBD2612017.1 hypothetical protein [Nostoc punctiforme FACHB-252]